MEKEAEWLLANNETNDATPANEWHRNFQVDDVELPKRALPIHYELNLAL